MVHFELIRCRFSSICIYCTNVANLFNFTLKCKAYIVYMYVCDINLNLEEQFGRSDHYFQIFSQLLLNLLLSNYSIGNDIIIIVLLKVILKGGYSPYVNERFVNILSC